MTALRAALAGNTAARTHQSSDDLIALGRALVRQNRDAGAFLRSVRRTLLARFDRRRLLDVVELQSAAREVSDAEMTLEYVQPDADFSVGCAYLALALVGAGDIVEARRLLNRVRVIDIPTQWKAAVLLRALLGVGDLVRVTVILEGVAHLSNSPVVDAFATHVRQHAALEPFLRPGHPLHEKSLWALARLNVLLACHRIDDIHTVIPVPSLAEAMLDAAKDVPPQARAAALSKVAEAFARRGNFAAAIRVARAGPAADRALTLVVVAAADAGRFDIVDGIIQDALMMTPTEIQVLLRMVEWGHPERAYRSTPPDRRPTAVAIAVALALSPTDPDWSRRILADAQRTEADAELLTAIADAQRRIGWFDDARHTLESAKAFVHQSVSMASTVRSLVGIATTQRRSGWTRDAAETIAFVVDIVASLVDEESALDEPDVVPSYVDRCAVFDWLPQIVDELVRCGMTRQAVAILRKADARPGAFAPLSGFARARAALVVAQFAASDVPLDTLLYGSDDATLQFVAEQFCTAGEFTSARIAAHWLADRDLAARSLANAAATAFGRVARASAEELVCASLRVGHWRHSLDTIADLDPDCLDQLAVAVLNSSAAEPNPAPHPVAPTPPPVMFRLVVDPTTALLAVQRSLIDVVTTDLRAVAVKVDSTAVDVRFVFAGTVDDDTRELVSVAETEVMADFPGASVHFTVDASTGSVPQRLRADETWVFRRYEMEW